uniref:MRN complex-interacting protein N-terminal domain-containing protein n=1 Tax=Amphiprion ocellaris TaxID=80972 RepID=A0AAQ5YJE5_AMPOC
MSFYLLDHGHDKDCVFALCCVCQVKKVNRWSCKLCGEKQSLLKEYGRGSGADCRRHVQKLNLILSTGGRRETNRCKQKLSLC